jgi:DNA-directed RNA polymerase
MKELHNNPNTIINTPVFLDATCSGIQHLSALLLDLELGISVNLSPYKQDDGPNDIYSDLIEPINKAINNYGEDNYDFAALSLTSAPTVSIAWILAIAKGPVVFRQGLKYLMFLN